jgi:hypothetical protein
MAHAVYVDETGSEIDKSLLDSPEESVIAANDGDSSDGSEDTVSA